MYKRCCCCCQTEQLCQSFLPSPPSFFFSLEQQTMSRHEGCNSHLYHHYTYAACSCCSGQDWETPFVANATGSGREDDDSGVHQPQRNNIISYWWRGRNWGKIYGQQRKKRTERSRRREKAKAESGQPTIDNFEVYKINYHLLQLYSFFSSFSLLLLMRPFGAFFPGVLQIFQKTNEINTSKVLHDTFSTYVNFCISPLSFSNLYLTF